MNAAILCSHGHGSYGKDPVAGMLSCPGMVDAVNNMNYNYAEQMAKAGFLTISPELNYLHRFKINATDFY